MDHYSILERENSASEARVPGIGAGRSALPSVSAGIAAASAAAAAVAALRHPSDFRGDSLAEIAERDLDAALQLLAERAQYITSAGGVAIALRRAQRNHMVCRASVGANAPELGTLLSTEDGLSGESVRTQQVLRCDDTERDTRVNRDGCRQLGIRSVMVLPIVSDAGVLGVFELFSGEPQAFSERDLSALQRLGHIVETAVRHTTAEVNPITAEVAEVDGQLSVEVIDTDAAQLEELVADSLPSSAQAKKAVLPDAPSVDDRPVLNVKGVDASAALLGPELKQGTTHTTNLPASVSQPPSQAQKPAVLTPAEAPRFWSADLQSPHAAQEKEASANPVPLGLRKLQKCSVCGFPVSQGRTLCVECEEKKWRGMLRVQQRVEAATSPEPERTLSEALAPATKGEDPVASKTPIGENIAGELKIEALPIKAASMAEKDSADSPPQQGSSASRTALFQSSLPLSQSWFSAHRYMLIAAALIGAAIAAVALLR